VLLQATAPVLIISDARRMTDLAFFIDRSAGGAKRWATLTVPGALPLKLTCMHIRRARRQKNA